MVAAMYVFQTDICFCMEREESDKAFSLQMQNWIQHAIPVTSPGFIAHRMHPLRT